MIVLINDVGSTPKINECSDSYSTVFRRCKDCKNNYAKHETV